MIPTQSLGVARYLPIYRSPFDVVILKEGTYLLPQRLGERRGGAFRPVHLHLNQRLYADFRDPASGLPQDALTCTRILLAVEYGDEGR